ncbi:hypothetical protein TWF730_008627 [Orbilia blumenaviensis]|uniref:Uncharacterized protein n=1 Tax=Orbilia blumenaviensis TaxID=1796055 RepID=A0AAV9V5X4_9PEZI
MSRLISDAQQELQLQGLPQPVSIPNVPPPPRKAAISGRYGMEDIDMILRDGDGDEFKVMNLKDDKPDG